MKKNTIKKLASGLLVAAMVAIGGYDTLKQNNFDFAKTLDQLANNQSTTAKNQTNVDITDYSNTAITYNGISIPQFDGTSDAYILNNNEPFFTSEDLEMANDTVVFSSLDKYGRAGVANGNISVNTMQTHERGSIQDIHPSGWWEAKQTDVNVNRSHLIGNNLAGDQTDCTENMITGSRQLNAGGDYDESMLDYEIYVAEYMETTGNHVRYRVTPVFENNDATCHGVVMEAYSLEDGGNGLKFCVYIYNVQSGYVCDYLTGVWEKI